MADLSAAPDTGDDHGPGTGRETTATPGYPGAPRWVKAAGIAVLILALLLAIAMVLGGGNHGPGRHMPSGGYSAPMPYGGQAL